MLICGGRGDACFPGVLGGNIKCWVWPTSPTHRSYIPGDKTENYVSPLLSFICHCIEFQLQLLCFFHNTVVDGMYVCVVMEVYVCVNISP